MSGFGRVRGRMEVEPFERLGSTIGGVQTPEVGLVALIFAPECAASATEHLKKGDAVALFGSIVRTSPMLFAVERWFREVK